MVFKRLMWLLARASDNTRCTLQARRFVAVSVQTNLNIQLYLNFRFN